MLPPKITYTQEDYLRALYLLEQDKKKSIKLKDIALMLNLSKSTITQRIQGLLSKGYVEKNHYGPVCLTKEGRRIAQNLTYKHRIIEIFLRETLEMHPDEVHEEAHALEHAISDKVIQKLADFLGQPTKCPHGQELPDFVAVT